MPVLLVSCFSSILLRSDIFFIVTLFLWTRVFRFYARFLLASCRTCFVRFAGLRLPLLLEVLKDEDVYGSIDSGQQWASTEGTLRRIESLEQIPVEDFSLLEFYFHRQLDVHRPILKGKEFVTKVDFSLTSGMYSLYDDIVQWFDACVFRGDILHELGIEGFERWVVLLMILFCSIVTKWFVLLILLLNLTAVLLLITLSLSRTGVNYLGRLMCRAVLWAVCLVEIVILFALAVSFSGVGGFLPPSRLVFHWVWSPVLPAGKFHQMVSQPTSELALLFQLDNLAVVFVTMTLWVGNVCVLGLSDLRASPRMSAAAILVKLFAALAFASFGLFSYIVFMEATVLPLLFWLRGGLDTRRLRAGLYYAGYSFFSGLIALAVCGYMVGSGYSTVFSTFGESLSGGAGFLSYPLICLLVCSLLVKVPVVPFHHWLLVAHVEASTAGSVLLAAVLWKLPAVAWLRIVLALADSCRTAVSVLLVSLALASLLVATARTWYETDLKRLVAYSSIVHIGGIVLVMSASAFVDSVTFVAIVAVLLVAHSFSAAALFVCAGAVSGRFHSRDVSCIRGLGSKMPRLHRLLQYAVFVGIGVPVSLVFVGEVALIWTLSSYQLLLAGLLLLFSFSVLFVRFFAVISEVATGSPHANTDAVDLTTTECAVLVAFLFVASLAGFGGAVLIAASARRWQPLQSAGRRSLALLTQRMRRTIQRLTAARLKQEPLRRRVKPTGLATRLKGRRSYLGRWRRSGLVCRPNESEGIALRRQSRLLRWRFAFGSEAPALAPATGEDRLPALREPLADSRTPTSLFDVLASTSLTKEYARFLDPLHVSSLWKKTHRTSIFERLVNRLHLDSATQRAVWRGMAEADSSLDYGNNAIVHIERLSNSILNWHGPERAALEENAEDLWRLGNWCVSRVLEPRDFVEVASNPKVVEERRREVWKTAAFFPEAANAALSTLGADALPPIEREASFLAAGSPDDPALRWWRKRSAGTRCDCRPNDMRIDILLAFLKLRKVVAGDSIAGLLLEQLHAALLKQKGRIREHHVACCVGRAEPVQGLLSTAPSILPALEDIALFQNQGPESSSPLVELYRRWFIACKTVWESECLIPEGRRIPRRFLVDLFFMLASDRSVSSKSRIWALANLGRDQILSSIDAECNSSKWPRYRTLEDLATTEAFNVPPDRLKAFIGPRERLWMLYDQFAHESRLYRLRQTWLSGPLGLYWQAFEPERPSHLSAAARDFEGYLLRRNNEDKVASRKKPIVAAVADEKNEERKVVPQPTGGDNYPSILRPFVQAWQKSAEAPQPKKKGK